MTTFPTPDHIRYAQSTAITVFAETGFYRWPSAVLAQAILESAGWTKLAGKNNGLGIKDFRPGHGTTNLTHETINGVDRVLPQPFADFESIEACYLSNAYLFTKVKRYRDAGCLTAPAAETFIRRMGPIYATAPNYVDTLLKICRDRKLYQYDQAHGPSAEPKPSAPAPAPAPTGFWAWVKSILGA